jgi:hypothetical protein
MTFVMPILNPTSKLLLLSKWSCLVRLVKLISHRAHRKVWFGCEKTPDLFNFPRPF